MPLLSSVEQRQTLLLWLAAAMARLLLVLDTGATLGEHLVRLRPASTGRLHLLTARPIRWGVGIGGFCLLQIPVGGWYRVAALALLGLHAIVALVGRRHRGLAHAVTGLSVDARTHLTGPGPTSG